MSIVVSQTLPNCASNGTILINSLGKREVVNSAYLHSFPLLNISVMRLRETMPQYLNILQTDTGCYCRTNCQLKYLRKDIANGVSKKGTLLVNIKNRSRYINNCNHSFLTSQPPFKICYFVCVNIYLLVSHSIIIVHSPGRIQDFWKVINYFMVSVKQLFHFHGIFMKNKRTGR